eukprot:437532-Pyramimonas_sp.AAC.1
MVGLFARLTLNRSRPSELLAERSSRCRPRLCFVSWRWRAPRRKSTRGGRASGPPSVCSHCGRWECENRGRTKRFKC